MEQSQNGRRVKYLAKLRRVRCDCSPLPKGWIKYHQHYFNLGPLDCKCPVCNTYYFYFTTKPEKFDSELLERKWANWRPTE